MDCNGDCKTCKQEIKGSGHCPGGALMFGRGQCEICGCEFINRPNQRMCTAHQEGYDKAMDDVEHFYRVLSTLAKSAAHNVQMDNRQEFKAEAYRDAARLLRLYLLHEEPGS